MRGKKPHMSSCWNQYIFTLYDSDSNCIFIEPLKTKQGKEIATAFESCYQRLKNTRKTNLHVLDNACSDYLKVAFTKAGIEFELVPPHIHRRNAVQKAIRTMKNYLLADLATYNPIYPIQEWDRLLDQCKLTLNFLRNSCINHNLSAWVYTNGVDDFNKSTLAPTGTKVVMHRKISKQ